MYKSGCKIINIWCLEITHREPLTLTWDYINSWGGAKIIALIWFDFWFDIPLYCMSHSGEISKMQLQQDSLSCSRHLLKGVCRHDAATLLPYWGLEWQMDPDPENISVITGERDSCLQKSVCRPHHCLSGEASSLPIIIILNRRSKQGREWGRVLDRKQKQHDNLNSRNVKKEQNK